MGAVERIGIIGLGYVGLPLAVALARHFRVTGFDLKEERVKELHAGRDSTGEIDPANLRASTFHATTNPEELKGAGIFIITVPTPVTNDNLPDLTAVKGACKTVGRVMNKGAIVVLESTVYPGVTEDICGPLLEEISGLKSGTDFFLGYSPERINPGDREHTVERIMKVVAGQNPEITEKLAEIYGAVTTGGIFKARNIRTAEAAKVIENAQRDINIAFINEVTMIFGKMGLSVHDVLEASGTKWNFLPFKPGLVGGHCIGVDPYYLAHCSLGLGHNPEVILAGRKVNDGMGRYISSRIDEALQPIAQKPGRVLILGLTFKENVPDLRNSKVVDIYNSMKELGYSVDVHDPLASPQEAMEHYGIKLLPVLEGMRGYDCIIGAVAHSSYCGFTAETFSQLLRPRGLVADVKGMWRKTKLSEGLVYWQL